MFDAIKSGVESIAAFYRISFIPFAISISERSRNAH